MRGLQNLREISGLDITIAYTRGGRKCWLLKPSSQIPFRDQITPCLTKKQMEGVIDNLLKEKGGNYDQKSN